jgi:hypothetical protein
VPLKITLVVLSKTMFGFWLLLLPVSAGEFPVKITNKTHTHTKLKKIELSP